MRPGALKGTAIFDALFHACFYGFDKADPTTTANFILLFSDGEDTAGQATLKDALYACQQRNVAIYAFYFSTNLVYNPASFIHDGTFHQIELQPPDRVRKIEVRSGYYAPFR
jgi:hypothetical protein